VDGRDHTPGWLAGQPCTWYSPHSADRSDTHRLDPTQGWNRTCPRDGTFGHYAGTELQTGHIGSVEQNENPGQRALEPARSPEAAAAAPTLVTSNGAA